jgi:hypothetical protein
LWHYFITINDLPEPLAAIIPARVVVFTVTGALNLAALVTALAIAPGLAFVNAFTVVLLFTVVVFDAAESVLLPPQPPPLNV